jgi:hypothetical protein
MPLSKPMNSMPDIFIPLFMGSLVKWSCVAAACLHFLAAKAMQFDFHMSALLLPLHFEV